MRSKETSWNDVNAALKLLLMGSNIRVQTLTEAVHASEVVHVLSSPPYIMPYCFLPGTIGDTVMPGFITDPQTTYVKSGTCLVAQLHQGPISV